jgi:hypothetical protein
MIKTVFIVVMFSFIVIVVGTNNAYAHFDKSKERQVSIEEVNMTDKMKYLCLQIDAKDGIDKMKDKEQQKQCEEFLAHVSISEIKDLIDKYQKK